MLDKKSDKKQERIENFERQREKMKKAGYKESSGIISVLRANVLAFVTAGPICIAAYILYFIRWGERGWIMNGRNLIFFFALFFAAIFVHELCYPQLVGTIQLSGGRRHVKKYIWSF